MKKSKTIPLLLGLTLTLTGCEFSFGPYNPSSDDSSTNTEGSHASSDDSYVSNGDGYYKVDNFKFSAADYYEASESYYLPSTGSSKMLVVPIEFTNAKAEDVKGGKFSREEVHTKIEKTFFGNSEDTEWESLKSFYTKSSGGLLNLEGTVAPFYQTNMSTSEFEELTQVRDPENAKNYDPTWTILENAIEDIKAKGDIDLREFDQNNDGFIDAVFMVYMANYVRKEGSLLWAYQFFDYDSYFLEDDDVNSPAPFNYAWASIYFMFEGYGDDKIDAHTYIHESGHILGLDDYYTYTDGDWSALGGIDMMDYNIGDHNGYSKMVLDWKLPYYIDGSEDVVKMSLTPGELVLIKDNWNKTAFDEYLLLEFYDPTGLNAKDQTGYPGNGARSYSEPGIKLYHVDSRIGKYDGYTEELISYVDVLNHNADTQFLGVAMSNSSEFSEEENFKLLHLIEPNGGNNLVNKPGVYADDSYLFYSLDKFIPSAYDKKNGGFVRNNGIRFNDGNRINYEINVTSVKPSEAKVTITKI